MIPSWTFLAPVLTYIGGLLTKPLTDVIANRRDRKRLRKALYLEFGANLQYMHMLVITQGEAYKNVDWWKRTEVYVN